MVRQFGFDFEGVEAEKTAFKAMRDYARQASSANHDAMMRALAVLSDDRCQYVLAHFSADAFDVSAEKIAEYRAGKK